MPASSTKMPEMKELINLNQAVSGKKEEHIDQNHNSSIAKIFQQILEKLTKMDERIPRVLKEIILHNSLRIMESNANRPLQHQELQVILDIEKIDYK